MNKNAELFRSRQPEQQGNKIIPFQLRVFILTIAVGLTAAAMAGCQNRGPGYAGSGGSGSNTDGDRVSLPGPRTDRTALEEVLFSRRSVRSFQEQSVPLSVLSDVMWSSIGVGVDGVSGATRTAPSAGGTNPLVIYLGIRDIEGLEAGVYRYNVSEHQLIQKSEDPVVPALAKAALGQTWINEAQAVVVITADYSRTTRRYGERGRRYVHFEAGHAAQNIVLTAGNNGLGSTVIGAFHDDEVKKALGGTNLDPLLIIPLGWK